MSKFAVPKAEFLNRPCGLSRQQQRVCEWRRVYRYDGKMVWLSTENQFNYKAAYDLTVQTAGATLPVTFKLGDDDNPEYVTFETLETLTAFFTGAMQFVQKTLLDGWNAKDAIDLELYRVN